MLQNAVGSQLLETRRGGQYAQPQSGVQDGVRAFFELRGFHTNEQRGLVRGMAAQMGFSFTTGGGKIEVGEKFFQQRTGAYGRV